jgi:single-strand DNA-binding protein
MGGGNQGGGYNQPQSNYGGQNQAPQATGGYNKPQQAPVQAPSTPAPQEPNFEYDDDIPF